ncbi:glycosyltransferase [Sulfurospirillum sp. 1307]|jgi:glycosyltransferase involved in cell wall biosynthesis
MKKFLYITDREEYSEHNFIGPLFEKYLPEYMDVNIVYFSKYKSYFENKNGKFIVPLHEKNDILKYLSQNGVKVFEYDYVVVRNMHEILDRILEHKDIYGIKVGFRLSFPKITAKLERAKAENRSSLIKEIDTKLKTSAKAKLINRCDIFLPTSRRMQKIYYPNITTKIHVIPSAIDPDRIHSKVQREDENILFSYQGTLSKLRNFELVLEAFSRVSSKNWELIISTPDIDYAKQMVSSKNDIKDNIKIIKIDSKVDLLDELSKSDVGLALLPDLNIYSTSVPLKVIDYYTGAIPTLMTNNELNTTIFEDGENAWLSKFEVKDIHDKLEEIIKTPKEKITQMGKAGQEKLLKTRNYKDIAKELASAMESIKDPLPAI